MSNIAIANRNDNGRRVLFCIGEKSKPLLPVCEVKLLGWRREYAARKIMSRSTNRVFVDSTSEVGQTPLALETAVVLLDRENGIWLWYQIIAHIHHN